MTPTTRPRIVSETKREVEEREPPPASSVESHPWLSAESLMRYDKVLASGLPFSVYISSLAEGKIRRHALKEAPKRLEVLGFLLGEVSTWQGSTYTMVRDIGTTQLRSSPSKVRFDPAAFPRLFLELDDAGFDYVLVGWYHSHPGHTCFMSRTDIETQRTMFSEPYHSALVIDPINEDIKNYRLFGEGYEEAPFALIRSPPRTASERRTRTRKLKIKPVSPR